MPSTLTCNLSVSSASSEMAASRKDTSVWASGSEADVANSDPCETRLKGVRGMM